MARTVRNATLETRNARSKLPIRREPHWQRVSKGCYIGYRCISGGGTWIARFRDADGRQHYDALGAADDNRDADGISAFNFSQAQERARTFFARRARELSGEDEVHEGPFTVKAALDDYFAHRRRQGSRGVASDVSAANSRIVPTLGDVEISRLTARQIERWQDTLAAAPRLVRASKAAKERPTRPVDADNPDAIRRRRATANRVFTILKAALNLGFSRRKVTSDDAWRRVKPFKGVDEARVRYLSQDECRRLINAADADFRALLRGALLTGARYGELTHMQVADFDAKAKTVQVRRSKSGKPRHIALTDEGCALLATQASGKSGADPLFRREDGKAWGKSHQARPIEEASRRAAVAPPATFHILRHTYASMLAMRGVPMAVIAAQLGHADTRMTEKHYAHLAPSYVADTIRAALPEIGGAEKSNVVSLIA